MSAPAAAPALDAARRAHDGAAHAMRRLRLNPLSWRAIRDAERALARFRRACADLTDVQLAALLNETAKEFR